jgi:hypothetical protein
MEMEQFFWKPGLETGVGDSAAAAFSCPHGQIGYCRFKVPRPSITYIPASIP